jgi:5'(3')-deoxyribonucleotidase
LKIAFDVDNVLADSMTCWCNKATKHLDRIITREEIKSDKIVGSVQMSPHEIFTLQDEVWTEWHDLPATEEHLSRKLCTLKENGFQVFVVTSRPLRSVDLVKKWLAWQEIPYDEFQAISPYRSKREIEADALVDDTPNQIREFIRTGRTGFLYVQPWNKNAKVRKAIIVESVDGVLKFYGLEKHLHRVSNKKSNLKIENHQLIEEDKQKE